MSDGDVFVVEVDNRQQGEYLLDDIELQQEHGIFTVQDAAVAYRNDNGKVKLSQTKDMTAGRGAGWGAGIGLLAGLIIGGPIAAALLGAGVGALSAGIGDRGIDNGTMKRYESHLNNGHALVFVKADAPNAARVDDWFEGKALQYYRGEVRRDLAAELAAAHADASN